MTEHMDVVGSLKKIARELAALDPYTNPVELMEVVSGAAFMIKWIADGLQQELILAAERGKRKELS